VASSDAGFKHRRRSEDAQTRSPHGGAALKNNAGRPKAAPAALTAALSSSEPPCLRVELVPCPPQPPSPPPPYLYRLNCSMCVTVSSSTAIRCWGAQRPRLPSGREKG
jgi:hypothetical protein